MGSLPAMVDELHSQNRNLALLPLQELPCEIGTGAKLPAPQKETAQWHITGTQYQVPKCPASTSYLTLTLECTGSQVRASTKIKSTRCIQLLRVSDLLQNPQVYISSSLRST